MTRGADPRDDDRDQAVQRHASRCEARSQLAVDLLKPRVNRITNIVVSLLYAVTVLGSCIGETWAYYIVGSLVEAVLLLVIARTAWKWPLFD